jgi:hypothetical protein
VGGVSVDAPKLVRKCRMVDGEVVGWQRRVGMRRAPHGAFATPPSRTRGGGAKARGGRRAAALFLRASGWWVGVEGWTGGAGSLARLFRGRKEGSPRALPRAPGVRCDTPLDSAVHLGALGGHGGGGALLSKAPMGKDLPPRAPPVLAAAAGGGTRRGGTRRPRELWVAVRPNRKFVFVWGVGMRALYKARGVQAGI